MIFNVPIRGVNAGFNPEHQPPATTDYMLNVVPVDVLESRVRIGQRPGLSKAYSEQISGAKEVIVLLTSVTVVD